MLLSAFPPALEPDCEVLSFPRQNQYTWREKNPHKPKSGQTKKNKLLEHKSFFRSLGLSKGKKKLIYFLDKLVSVAGGAVQGETWMEACWGNRKLVLPD